MSSGQLTFPNHRPTLQSPAHGQGRLSLAGETRPTVIDDAHSPVSTSVRDYQTSISWRSWANGVHPGRRYSNGAEDRRTFQ